MLERGHEEILKVPRGPAAACKRYSLAGEPPGMNRQFSSWGWAAALSVSVVAATSVALIPATARATGTITIVQDDGHSNVYDDVEIKVIHNALYMTSADGKGTLVINRAACSYQGKVMVCFVTSATLVQSGKTSPLDFKTGTLYVNLTDDPQSLVMSTMKVAPHSVLLSFTTKKGTYVSLTGRLDKVVK
jgi:hypothetical protein